MARKQRPWNPHTIVFHEYATPVIDKKTGKPFVLSRSAKNPYHVLVYPDGHVRYYHKGGDPYKAKAAHAWEFNSESIGISYAGPVGGQPTPEALKALEKEAGKAYKYLKARGVEKPTFWGHGEAWRKTGGRASQAGRSLREGQYFSQFKGWNNDDKTFDPTLTETPTLPDPVEAAHNAKMALGVKPPPLPEKYVPEEKEVSLAPPAPPIEPESPMTVDDTVPEGDAPPLPGRRPEPEPEPEAKEAWIEGPAAEQEPPPLPERRPEPDLDVELPTRRVEPPVFEPAPAIEMDTTPDPDLGGTFVEEREEDPEVDLSGTFAEEPTVPTDPNNPDGMEGMGLDMPAVDKREAVAKENLAEAQAEDANIGNPTLSKKSVFKQGSLFTAQDEANRKELLDQVKKDREALGFGEVIGSYDTWRSNFTIDLAHQAERQLFGTKEYWETDPEFEADTSALDKAEKEYGVEIEPEQYEWLAESRNKKMYDYRLAAIKSRKRGEKDWAKAGPMATTVGFILGLGMDMGTSTLLGALTGGVATGSLHALHLTRAAKILNTFRKSFKGQMILGAAGGVAEMKMARQSGLVSDEDVYIYGLLFGAAGPPVFRAVGKAGKAGLDVGQVGFKKVREYYEQRAVQKQKAANGGVTPPVRSDPSADKDLSGSKDTEPSYVDLKTTRRRQSDEVNQEATNNARADDSKLQVAIHDYIQGAYKFQADAMEALKRQSHAAAKAFEIYVPTKRQKSGPMVGYRDLETAQRELGMGNYQTVRISKDADIFDAKDSMTGDNTMPFVVLPNPKMFKTVKKKGRNGVPLAKYLADKTDKRPIREVAHSGRDLRTDRPLDNDELQAALRDRDDDYDMGVTTHGGAMVSDEALARMEARKRRVDPLEFHGVTNKAKQVLKKLQRLNKLKDQILPASKHSIYTAWSVAEHMLSHPVKVIRAVQAQSWIGGRVMNEKTRESLGPINTSPQQVVRSKNNEHVTKRLKARPKLYKQFLKEIGEEPEAWIDFYNRTGKSAGMGKAMARLFGWTPRNTKALTSAQKEELFVVAATVFGRQREELGHWPDYVPKSIQQYVDVLNANMNDSLDFASNPGGHFGKPGEYRGIEAAQRIKEKGKDFHLPRIPSQTKMLALERTYGPDAIKDFYEAHFIINKQDGGWAKDFTLDELAELAVNFKSQIRGTGERFSQGMENVLDDVSSRQSQQFLRNAGVSERILDRLEALRLHRLKDNKADAPSGRLMTRVDIDVTKPILLKNRKTGQKETVFGDIDVYVNDIDALHDGYTRSTNGWGAMSMWKVIDPDTGIPLNGKMVDGVWHGIQTMDDVETFAQTLKDIQQSLGHPEKVENEYGWQYNPSELMKYMVRDTVGAPQGERMNSFWATMRNLTNFMLLQNTSFSMTPEHLMAATSAPTHFAREWFGALASRMGHKNPEGMLYQMGQEIRRLSPEDRLSARRFLEAMNFTREYEMAAVSSRLDDAGSAAERVQPLAEVPNFEKASMKLQTFTLRYLSTIPGSSDANRLTIMTGKFDQLAKWANKYDSFDQIPKQEREWIANAMEPARVTELLEEVRARATTKQTFTNAWEMEYIDDASNAFREDLWAEFGFAADRVAQRDIQGNLADQGVPALEKTPLLKGATQLLSFSIRSVTNQAFNKAGQMSDAARMLMAPDTRMQGVAKMSMVGADGLRQVMGGILGYIIYSHAIDQLYDEFEVEERREGRYDLTNLAFAGIIRSPVMAGLPLFWDTAAAVGGWPTLSGYRSTGLSFSPADMAILTPVKKGRSAVMGLYEMATSDDGMNGQNLKDVTSIFGNQFMAHAMLQAGARHFDLEGLDGRKGPKNILSRILESED